MEKKRTKGVALQLLLALVGAFLGALIPITYSTLSVSAKVEQRVSHVEQSLCEYRRTIESLVRSDADHDARLLRNEAVLEVIKNNLAAIQGDVKKLLERR